MEEEGESAVSGPEGGPLEAKMGENAVSGPRLGPLTAPEREIGRKKRVIGCAEVTKRPGRGVR